MAYGIRRVEPVWLPTRVKNFAQRAKLLDCPEKTTLFWVGDPSDRVYFVEEGYVTMFHFTEEGDTVTLLLHHAGDIVGIGGVMDDGNPRAVCSETVGRCRIWEVTANAFYEMMYEYPEIAVWVAHDLSQRMKKIDQTVLRLVSMPASARIAVTLLDSAGRETASRSDPAVVHLTHQELANMIGICRQTATLFLGRFRDEGILDTGKGYIKLYDLNRLRTLAAEEK